MRPPAAPLATCRVGRCGWSRESPPAAAIRNAADGAATWRGYGGLTGQPSALPQTQNDDGEQFADFAEATKYVAPQDRARNESD
jgi:hypothetical protein